MFQHCNASRALTAAFVPWKTQWKELSAKEREKYESLAAADRQRYQDECEVRDG